MNTVALFADRWILPGLHATLASLLAHANPALPLRSSFSAKPSPIVSASS